MSDVVTVVVADTAALGKRTDEDSSAADAELVGQLVASARPRDCS
ncbi:hypothetical protein [Nocardia anaemiae]